MHNILLIKFVIDANSTLKNEPERHRNLSSNTGTTHYDLVGFVALRPKSTAMVIAGRSVHLTTLFPGQA